jgi:DNA polymerase-3 subunit delta
MLNLLLETSDFIPIFSMIIRQFRLLIQAKEILDEGGTERDIASRLHLHPFVARNLIPQAKKFDLAGLESIYHHLLEIDVDNKTGEMPGEVALDVMIAQLTEK